MSQLLAKRFYITQLVIQNYRTFQGKQKIDFSPDPKKPFTIIHGTSGEGKTTLLNSIHWCLFGEERAQNKILLNDTSEGIVNSQVFKNLSIGQSEETSVEIYIYEDDHPQFHIHRKLITTKNSESGILRKNTTNSALSPSNFSFEEDLFFEEWIGNETKGGLKDVDPRLAQNIILREFPKVLAEYLLYDAELLDSFEKNKSDKLVKLGIKEITGLPLLTNAKKHLELVAGKFEEDLGEGDSNYEGFRNRKITAKKIIEENNNIIELAQAKIEELNEKIKDIDNELLKKDESVVKEKAKLRETMEDSKKNWYDKQKEYEENQKELLQNNLWKFYLEKTLGTAKNKFDKYEEMGLIPPTVGRDAYDRIINENPTKCVICENIIEEDTELWKKILEKKEKTIDNASLREITLGRGYISNMIKDTNIDEMKKRYEKILTKLQECDTNIKVAEGEINKVNVFLTKVDFDNISSLEGDRSDLEFEITELNRKIGGSERLRDGAQGKLDEIEPKLLIAAKKINNII